jgi:hypothetical protein
VRIALVSQYLCSFFISIQSNYRDRNFEEKEERGKEGRMGRRKKKKVRRRKRIWSEKR